MKSASAAQQTLDSATVSLSGSISVGSFRNGGGANQLFNGVGKALDAWTAFVDNGRTGWCVQPLTFLHANPRHSRETSVSLMPD